MSTKAKWMKVLAGAAIATFAFQGAHAQYGQPRTAPRAIPPMSEAAKAVRWYPPSSDESMRPPA